VAKIALTLRFFMAGTSRNREQCTSLDLHLTYVQEREKIMTLSYGDLVAITIALGASIIMMFILAFANVQLLNENRFLKQRLRAWRKSCEKHVEVPF
jgi:hypothetical protein